MIRAGFAALCLALTTLGCTGRSTDPLASLPAAPEGSLKVLFIGNSLTYTHGLPQTISDLARADGQPLLYGVSVAYPDFSLADHLLQGAAARLLTTREWDFVVLQQGSSALPESRAALERDAKIFAPAITDAGGKTALFMVWPTQDQLSAFNDVRDSYRSAAEQTDGIFLPAGMAWLEAWDRDPTLILYAADGLHPSEMGTYLSALVIYQRLYNRPLTGLGTIAKVGGQTMLWDADLVQLLKDAAAAANTKEGHP